MEEVQNYPILIKIIEEVKADAAKRLGFGYQQGMLYCEGRLVISAQSSIIPKLLQELHLSPMRGHSGFYRTYRRMATNVYWIGMKGRIQEFVRSCDVCQQQLYVAASPGGLLQPLTILEMVWEEVSMDFITELPKSKGYEAMFVVVYGLSKYSHFMPLKHPYMAKTVAQVFAKEIICLHGLPAAIVSDRELGVCEKLLERIISYARNAAQDEFCLPSGVGWADGDSK